MKQAGDPLAATPYPGRAAFDSGSRALIESLRDGVCVIRLLFDDAGRAFDYRFVEANAAFQHQCGLPDPTGRTIRELVPDFEPQWIDRYAEVAATGRPQRFESEVPSIGGYYDIYAFVPEGCEPHHVGVVFSNITARHEAEARLQASEERHAFLLRLHDRLRLLDDAGAIQHEAACALGQQLRASRVGYGEDQGDGLTVVVTRNYVDAVASIEGRHRYEDFGARLWQDLRAGTTVVRADIAGDPGLCEAEKLAHRELQVGATVDIPLVKGGRLVALLFVHQAAARRWTADELALMDDVAQRTWAAVERARAEAALRESRARLLRELEDARRLQEVSSLLIENERADELFERVLQAALAIMHADFGSIQMLDADGQALLLLASKNFHPEAARQWQRVSFASGTACGAALQHGGRIVMTDVRADPRVAAASRAAFALCGITSVQSTPLTTRAGRVIGMISTHWRDEHEPTARDLALFDVLARQTADVVERRRANEALRADARHKDEFLAMLAHELRNPLAPIRMSADVLARIGLADARQKEACAVIERQTRHMARMLDDLLDISRVTQRKVTLVRERIAVDELIARAVESSRPLVESHRHRLGTTLPREQLHVEGDPTRLVQVLGNLVNNAAKYTRDGGNIAVEAAREGDHAVIRVRDDGSGIPADLLPHVFDLFRQGSQSLERAQGGLGIGLTLVRQLAELHGGSVEARSAGANRGSEFTVRLPVAADARGEEEGADRRGGARASRGSLRILLVEDNADAASSLATLLAIDGHDVQVAGDGPSGLTAAQAFVPQVVICDIGLPGMSGYEVGARIRALPALQATTLVALSGYGREDDRRSAAEAGFAWHLTKPVEPKVLADLLSSLGS